MNTLDAWEAENKRDTAEFDDLCTYEIQQCKRILVLIDLIKKKDQEFLNLKKCGGLSCHECTATIARGLELTEKLNDQT